MKIFQPTITGSTSTSGSLDISGSLIVTEGITGSLYGTSSWAENVVNGGSGVVSLNTLQGTLLISGTQNVTITTSSNTIIITGYDDEPVTTNTQGIQTNQGLINNLDTEFSNSSSLAIVTASVTDSTITFTKGGGDTFNITIDTGSDGLWSEGAANDIYYTSGQVGIGTDAPDHQLFVSGSDQCLAVFKSSTNGGGITFMDNGTADDFSVGIGAFDNNLCFLAGGSQSMRILDTGEVGIGTLTPTEALQVVGNISASGDITGNNFTIKGIIDVLSDNNNLSYLTQTAFVRADNWDAERHIVLWRPNSSYYTPVGMLGTGVDGVWDAGKGYRFYLTNQAGDAPSSSQHLAILQNGDIEIDYKSSEQAYNLSGSAKLYVNGNISTTSHITASGNISASGFIGDLTGTANTASYVAGANVDGVVGASTLAASAIYATNADNVDIDNVSADTIYGFVFRDGDSFSYQQLYADSQADTPGWNPSTNTITAPIISASTAFSGDLDGNASTATTASYAITASYALNGGGGAGGPAPVVKLTAPGTITIDDDTYDNKFVYVSASGDTEVEFEGYALKTYNAGDEYYFMSDSGTITLVNLGPEFGLPPGKTVVSRGANSVIGVKVMEATGASEPFLLVFGDLA